MEKEPDLEKLVEYMRKEGFAWEKPGPQKEERFDQVYLALQKEGLEKWDKVEYPYTHEEMDGSDFLLQKATMATGEWVCGSVGLYKSNITGDYKAEVKVERPEYFKFDKFKKTVHKEMPDIIYMYNSTAEVTDVLLDDSHAYVNLDLKLAQGLRITNLAYFVQKNFPLKEG